jgi:hypothetical protein
MPRPTPFGIGALLAVVLLVVGFTVLLAVGLVLFLWYRKRKMRGVEMIRPDASSTGSARRRSTQQSKPTVSTQDFAAEKRRKISEHDRAKVTPHRSLAYLL